MGKASKKKRQQELQAESILNGKSLISSDISSNWSLFNKPLVHLFLIAIVGLLAYSNTFHVPFQWDDTPNIVANYKLKDLTNFWPPSDSRWFGFLTFALNYYLGGLNTLGYHIVNLAIHILNAILVYWLVVLTFRTPIFSNQLVESSLRQSAISSQDNLKPYLPLFIALIFVSHPIQTQAVTYIVQRFTSLATMFYLLSLVMYIKFRSRQSAIIGQQKLPATRYILYAASLISAILAMKTKEISFTLPIIIVLYEFMFFEGKFKKRILFLVPIILTMLIIPLSMIGIDKPVGDAIGELREAAQETDEIPRWSYLFTQFRVIVTYIRLLFLPINQNLDYDYPLYHSFLNPSVFLSFLFLLSIFGLGVYLLYCSHTADHNSPALHPTRYTLPATRLTAFGIFWFFITLSVESSIIPIRDVIFEHRVYLPSIGIAVAFTSALFYFISRLSSYSLRFSLSAVYLLLSAAVVVLSIATYQRNTVWKDEVTLWKDTANKNSKKARASYNLGLSYQDKNNFDKAIDAYNKAIIINSNESFSYNNRGNIYLKIGLYVKALDDLTKAIAINPNFAEAYINRGVVYFQIGQYDIAIEDYNKAIAINPTIAKAFNNRGNAYDEKGQPDRAIEDYNNAVKVDPNYSDSYFNRGITYTRLNKIDSAILDFQKACDMGSNKSCIALNRALENR